MVAARPVQGIGESGESPTLPNDSLAWTAGAGILTARASAHAVWRVSGGLYHTTWYRRGRRRRRSYCWSTKDRNYSWERGIRRSLRIVGIVGIVYIFIVIFQAILN